eukprot:15357009-Ditylum_brightwellii.AAC.1
MAYLQQEDFQLALKLLKKAEILTEKDAASQVMMCNNLVCFYHQQDKLRSALQYLRCSLQIESQLRINNVTNAADTYLNACAVLLQLGCHQLALEHSQSALILLQEELFKGLAVQDETTTTTTMSGGKEHKQDNDDKQLMLN